MRIRSLEIFFRAGAAKWANPTSLWTMRVASLRNNEAPHQRVGWAPNPSPPPAAGATVETGVPPPPEPTLAMR